MSYEIKDASKTFSKFYCPVGRFNRGTNHARADICIKTKGVSASELRINRNMLREVLLENPDDVRELLGLVVKPYVEKQKKAVVQTKDVGFVEDQPNG